MFGSHTSKQASAPGKRIRGTGSQGVSQANGDGKRLKKAGPEPNAEVMKENADYKRINSDLMKRCSTLETAMQVSWLTHLTATPQAMSVQVDMALFCVALVGFPCRYANHGCLLPPHNHP